MPLNLQIYHSHHRKQQEILNVQTQEGINFKNHKENTPKAVTTFDQAGLHQVCLRNIKGDKYTKPTPVGKYAWPAVLSKEDLMVCA